MNYEGDPRCANCLFGAEGVCDNCFGAEGETTEISDSGWCQNFEEAE